MLTLLRYSSVTLREHGLQLAIHFTAQHVIHLPDDTAAAVSGGRAAAAVPVTERSDFTIKVLCVYRSSIAKRIFAILQTERWATLYAT